MVVASLLAIGLLSGLQDLTLKAWGQTAPPVTGEPTGKDKFQATQWLKVARELWEVGDYPLLRRYCQMIIDRYPGTSYGREAEKLLKRSSNPAKNRSREFRRNNPGLFLD